MDKEGNYQDRGIRCGTVIPGKPQLCRWPWPDGGNNKRHALFSRESIFAAVRCADATSQYPIATGESNSSVDTHTHEQKQPYKERLGRGEGFLQKRQREHPRRARFGVLRISAACKVQLSVGTSSRIRHQP